MAALFAFCALAPPALLLVAYKLRTLPIVVLGGYALCGYHAATLQMYWGHRFVHFQMRRRALYGNESFAVGAAAACPPLPCMRT